MATKTLAAAALAATTMLAALPASAESTSLWQTFQKWEVRVDGNLGHGCFMQASYPASGTVLRIGFNITHDDSYFEIMNQSWSSLRIGTDMTVMLSFDNRQPQPWTGRVITLTDGSPVLYFPTKNFQVLDLVAAASTINITFNGQSVLYGQLYGSAQAVHGMAECQQAFLAASRPSDPFRSTAPARPLDPFKTL